MNAKQTIRALVKHDIFIPALLGVALRMVLMPFFIWPSDIVAQQSSLTCILNHYDPYSLSVSMYPPFVYLLLYPFLLIASRAGFTFLFHIFPVTFNAGMVTGMITSFFGDPAFLVFWKFPLLVFDLLTGLLVYSLTKELAKDSSKAKKGFVLWFFNPFVLITSYIHGAFDVIAVFFILLGIYLLSKNKYLLSGVSFGFGGITKISPFLIAIPLSALIFLGRTDESSRIFSRKRCLSTVAFLAGCAIPILISILWNINYYHLLTASTLNELSINGGLNEWFFGANSNLRSSLLNPNLNALTDIFYLYPIIGLVPLLFFRKTFRNSKINSHAVLLFSALSLIIVYFVSPITVQPQYILWLIPILSVIAMKNRSFYWPVVTLSLAASAFFFSIQSPFAFMYPVALFTSLYNVNQLNAIIIEYAKIPGVFCSFLREDLCLIFGAIGFFGLVLTILLIGRALRKADKDAPN
jgi:Gpi18-like mannosyltransferase